MTDDPRDILKAAGVECAEVEAWYEPWTYSEEVDVSAASEKAEDAFLALARLVAEFKWYAEHDIQLVPKDDWHTPGEPDQLGGFAFERRAGFVLTRLHRRWEEHSEDPDA